MSKTSLLTILGRAGLAAITPVRATGQTPTNWAAASFERILTEGKNPPPPAALHALETSQSNRTDPAALQP